MKRNTETVRPYRFWNIKTKSPEPYKYFSVALNAHHKALAHLHSWQKVGTTLELWNINTGRLLAQYTRTAEGIHWSHKEKS